jgi:molecular chaperone GrpE (heat shock protein)
MATCDFTPQLRQWMEPQGISTLAALSQQTQIPEKALRRLRRGEIGSLSLARLQTLANCLHISLQELLQGLGGLESPPQERAQPALGEVSSWSEEYQRLQQQLHTQQQEIEQAFQQSTLQILESLILQLPTAAYAAQQNPQLPAIKLLPLLGPIHQLLQSWKITAIAPVGETVPYDPQQHQLLEGTAEPGSLVRVRYTGYRQADQLLYRAKVSPAEAAEAKI